MTDEERRAQYTAEARELLDKVCGTCGKYRMHHGGEWCVGQASRFSPLPENVRDAFVKDFVQRRMDQAVYEIVIKDGNYGIKEFAKPREFVRITAVVDMGGKKDE